jgi:UDP-glucose 4-epimerase
VTTSLVTGGAGFLGSHLAEELLNYGHGVVVMDDLSGGFYKNVPERAFFVNGSVADEQSVNRMFDFFHFDYVYHLAAYAAEQLSPYVKRFNYTNNVLGTVNLINASVMHDVKCFTFMSSVAVYGSQQVPFSEEMVPAPDDSYGIAKFACERELEITMKRFGLPYVIFRGHNIYGERQNIGDVYRNVVGVFLNAALKGEPFPMYGKGDQQRAFTYVKDVVPMIASAPSMPSAIGQAWNIGSDEVSTIRHLADLIAHKMGTPLRINEIPRRGDIQVAYASHVRASRLFGTCNTPLERGLDPMIEWGRQHGAMEHRKFGAVEITKGLPESWR